MKFETYEKKCIQEIYIVGINDSIKNENNTKKEKLVINTIFSFFRLAPLVLIRNDLNIIDKFLQKYRRLAFNRGYAPLDVPSYDRYNLTIINLLGGQAWEKTCQSF